ncbi:hypothetical protein AAFN86_08885 [Roseomonas sp. CAU 1739]|uniref:hypothetical protein n=1 Tax=Roseomonas sp. CAU 1739 TaxID=3140364 RepID=UPI00325BC803
MVLSAQDALRAGRGLDLTSAAGDAIRLDSITQAEGDIATVEANTNNRTRRLGLASDSALTRGRNEASTALVRGYGSAVGSLAGGAAQAYGISSRAGSSRSWCGCPTPRVAWPLELRRAAGGSVVPQQLSPLKSRGLLV